MTKEINKWFIKDVVFESVLEDWNNKAIIKWSYKRLIRSEVLINELIRSEV